MKAEKQLLVEYTWPELSQKISESTAAFIPIGPQEGHGRYLPMGTDIYIATATGVVAAKEIPAIVLQPMAYAFTGATNGFRGTICIPMRLEMEIIKAIIRNLWQQQFRAIFVVSFHRPDYLPAMMAIRDLFEEEKIVASFFNPLHAIDTHKHKLDVFGIEAAMCCAAMEVLGLGSLMPSLEGLTNEPTPPLDFPEFDGMDTGFRYTKVDHHAPSRKVDLNEGRAMLAEAANTLAGKVKSLMEYSRFIEKEEKLPSA